MYCSSSKVLKNKLEKSEKRAKVISVTVDTYSRGKNTLVEIAKVYSCSVDTYNRARILNVFHSPCEIAFICCSMAYALYRKDLITEYRDVKDVCTTYKGK